MKGTGQIIALVPHCPILLPLLILEGGLHPLELVTNATNLATGQIIAQVLHYPALLNPLELVTNAINLVTGQIIAQLLHYIALLILGGRQHPLELATNATSLGTGQGTALLPSIRTATKSILFVVFLSLFKS